MAAFGGAVSAQRFLAVARRAGRPIGSLAFPELAFLENVEPYGIEDAIKEYETGCSPVPAPGKSGYVSYDPLPVPSWHTRHDWFEHLDELIDAVFLSHTTSKGEESMEWCVSGNWWWMEWDLLATT